MQFEQKVVVLTGASSGLGAALARRLLATGARVVLAARREERMRALLQESGAPDRGLVVPTDVTRHGDLERLVERTTSHFGALDVLVNNAGLGLTAPLSDFSPEEIEALVRLNLLGPMWLTRLALPALRGSGEGMVVNVSSMSAVAALPLQAAYVGAKGGLASFGHALRRELGGTGVRVLTAYPAALDTELLDGVRERAAALGVNTPVHPPDRAAEQLYRAMCRERRTVILGGLQDRLIAWVSHLAPRLLDGPLHRMRPTLADMGEAGNAATRPRLSLAEPIGETPP